MNGSVKDKKFQVPAQLNRSLDSNQISLPIKDSKNSIIKTGFNKKVEANAPVMSERVDPIVITVN